MRGQKNKVSVGFNAGILVGAVGGYMALFGIAANNVSAQGLSGLVELEDNLDKKKGLSTLQEEVMKEYESKMAKEDKSEQALDKTKAQTLVFKGFYLGMQVADAQRLLNNHLKLEQVGSEPAELKKIDQGQKLLVDGLMSELTGKIGPRQEPKGPFQIYKDNGKFFVQRTPLEIERPFAVASEDGAIIAFELSESVRNTLFDSAEMPTNEFLENFIRAYGIPSLNPSHLDLEANILGMVEKGVGMQTILMHRSARGFQLIYWEDPRFFDDKKAPFVSTVPGRTITINKIETASQRKSKFD